ncbi:hypothetical protein FGG78_44445 [Thioclava sp. BHET1]|nr:hypothetical protein FGG78_44445 [Thioclava sp. BHET1]
MALAACQPDSPKPPPVGPARLDQARAQCAAKGGRFERASAKSGYFCFTTPKDAGKVCLRSSDCSTSCLAKSHTCAPVSPLIGCHMLLDAAGNQVNECLR